MENEGLKGRLCYARNKNTKKTTHGTTWQLIKTWTELSLVEAVRATEDRPQWRKIVHDCHRGGLKNRTEHRAYCDRQCIGG